VKVRQLGLGTDVRRRNVSPNMGPYARLASTFVALAFVTAACGATAPASTGAVPTSLAETATQEVVSPEIELSAPWVHVEIGPQPGDTNAFILGHNGGIITGSIGSDYSTI
jgi:hypothetical protein